MALLGIMLPAVLPACQSTLEPLMDGCKSVDCSGHGECQIRGGKAVCICDQGYRAEGLACLENGDLCDGVDCSWHGTCEDSSGWAICVCDPGYVQDGLSCVRGECADDEDCDDGNPCTDCYCNIDTYTCVIQDNTNPCDDGNVCTMGDWCSSGECVGGPPPDCSGTGGMCREDSTCDPGSITANCDVPGAPVNEGLPCDKSACMVDETCSDGICTGGQPVTDGTPCDDGLMCNGTDTCDGTGTCMHAGDPCGELSCDELHDACRDQVWYGLGGSDYGSWDDRIQGSAWGSGISGSDFLPRHASVALDGFVRPVVAWSAREDDVYQIHIKRFDGNSWVEVGAGSSTGGGISDSAYESTDPSIVMAPDGNPIVAWVERDDGWIGAIYVRRFDGISWVEVGAGSASGGGISDGAYDSTNPSIVMAPDGNPIVAWAEDTTGHESYKVYVKKFDGDSWVEIGGGSASGDGICSGGGTVIATNDAGDLAVVCAIETAQPPGIFVKKFDGTSWSEVGAGSASGEGINDPGTECLQATIALKADGSPVVTWISQSVGPNGIYVKEFDGASWVEVGEGSASGEGISPGDQQFFGNAMVLDGADNPVVAWARSAEGGSVESRIYIKRFNGNNWEEVGVGSASGEGICPYPGAGEPDLAIDGGGNPVVAWEADGEGIHVRKYDGSNWVGFGDNLPVGMGLSDNARDSILPDLVVDDSGNPVVAWENSLSAGEAIYVKRYDGNEPGGAWVELGAGSVAGEGIGIGVGVTPRLGKDSAGNLFATYAGGCELKMYDGFSWLDLGSPECVGSVGCGCSSLAVDQFGHAVLAGAWSSVPRLNGGHAFIANHDGSSWSDFESPASGSMALDLSGNPVLAWSADDEIYVMTYDGDAWVEVGEGSASGGGVSSSVGESRSPVLAVNSAGNPVVAWVDSSHGNDEIYVKMYNGSTWIELGTTSASGGGVSASAGTSTAPSIAMDFAGRPVVAWEDYSSEFPEVYVKGFDGSRWVEIGTGSASGGGVSNSATNSLSPSINIGGGRICVAWSERWLYSTMQIVLRCTDE